MSKYIWKRSPNPKRIPSPQIVRVSERTYISFISMNDSYQHNQSAPVIDSIFLCYIIFLC